MNPTVHAIYCEYLERTDWDKSAAAALTLADVMQSRMDAQAAQPAPVADPLPTDRPVTPRELARHLRVTTHKVLEWIRSGELIAMNVATRQSKRPRYRIEAGDLAHFQQRRVSLMTPNGEQTVRRGGRRRRSALLASGLPIAATNATPDL